MTTPWQSTGAVARCLWYLSSSHNIYKNILGLAKWVCGRRPGFAAVQRRCTDSGICAGVLAHHKRTPATRRRRTYTHFDSPCPPAGAQRSERQQSRRKRKKAGAQRSERQQSRRKRTKAGAQRNECQRSRKKRKKAGAQRNECQRSRKKRKKAGAQRKERPQNRKPRKLA